MKRLIAKELREIRWFVAVIVATVLALGLLGDPMTYRGEIFATSWLLSPMAVAFLMGLSGYSRETAEDTLDFTFSHPVRWWWIPLAKIIAAAIALAGVAILSLPVYVLRMPAMYRPFVSAAGLSEGAAILWLVLAGAYLAGLLLSTIVPGVVLTFMVVIGGLGLYALVGTQASEVHPGPWISAPLLGLLVVAAILAMRPPLVVDRRRRMWLWGGASGLGLILMFVTAFALRATGADPRPPDRIGQYPSPDHGVTALTDYTRPGELWIEDSSGRFRLIDRATETQSLGWAPTERSFYYLVHLHNRAELRCASEAGGWRPQMVCALGHLDEDTGRLPAPTLDNDYSYILCFSPNGRRFAVGLHEYSSAGLWTAVFDLDRHRARNLPAIKQNGARHWWIDDNHLAVADEHFKVRVTKVWRDTTRAPRGQ